MKSLVSYAALLSLCSFAALAGADDHRRQGQQGHSRHDPWGGWSDIFKGHNHSSHHHQPTPKHPIPIDPGRGDGHSPVPPAPPTRPTEPAPRDGFVWVKDHWERAKAPPKVVTPFPTGPVVRDHRTPTGSYPAGTIVRDHRQPSSASGGVIVTVVEPRSGQGPIIRDHRTTPVVRDHRSQAN